MGRERFECRCESGWTLVLWRCLPTSANESKKEHPVVLCHGLGSNRYSFDLTPELSVAEHLAHNGWETWLVELRGLKIVVIQII